MIENNKVYINVYHGDSSKDDKWAYAELFIVFDNRTQTIMDCVCASYGKASYYGSSRKGGWEEFQFTEEEAMARALKGAEGLCKNFGWRYEIRKKEEVEEELEEEF